MTGASKRGSRSAPVSGVGGVSGEAPSVAGHTASPPPSDDAFQERQPNVPTPAETETADEEDAALRSAGGPWRLALDWMMTHLLRADPKVAFTWGRLDGNVAELEEHARQKDQDVVHVEFGHGSAGEPTSVWLAKFTRGKLVVHQDCELFRFNRKSRLELLTPTHRFRIGDDGLLKGRVTDLDEMRAARVAKTFAHWRSRAMEVASRPSQVDPAGEASAQTGPAGEVELADERGTSEPGVEET